MRNWLLAAITISVLHNHFAQADTIFDESRRRSIPVDITYPEAKYLCSKTSPCSAAFLSAGYGVSHKQYTFLSKQLNALGYLVIAVGHELADDPQLSVEGNLFETRQENWKRGATTIGFLMDTLSRQMESYNFNQILLVGHSNGGDISAWLANENYAYVRALITLDHRRVPLPRNRSLCVLTLRGSDFPADNGVLPSSAEVLEFGIKVVDIKDSEHNDFTDLGPAWLKLEITQAVRSFKSTCINPVP